MKLLQTLKQRVVRMLTSPGEELSSWARFVRFQVRLWYFCARRLRENNALAMSSALSFRTIFAMVPAIALSIVVLKSVGALDDSKSALRRSLEDLGFSQIVIMDKSAGATTSPATGPAATSRPGEARNLAAEIEKLVGRVEEKLTFGRIGPIGVALLIWSATTLLTTMERSLNRIFGARRARGTGRRVMLYWSAMTLGPIVFVLANYASDRAVESFGEVDWLSWIVAAVGWVQPILVGIALVTALYVLMPNTQVSVRAALGGAVVAFPLWLVAKWAFFLYVREVVGPNPLYGSLGLLPLSLLWLNLSWLLFLFGAELAATAASLGRMTFDEQAERTFLGPWELLAAAVLIAGRHAAGQDPPERGQIAEKLNLPERSVQALLDRLTDAGAVCPVSGAPRGAYVPARAPDKIKVAAVIEVADSAGGAPAVRRLAPDLARVVRPVQSRTREALKDMTLADLLKPAKPPADTPAH